MRAVWRDDYRSWGNTVPARHLVLRPEYVAEAATAARASEGANDRGPALAHGCGRSYGDVALNPGGGRLVDCRGLDRFIAFDHATGVLSCEAGVRLADILAVVCRPELGGAGWFLPVSPGTRFVTVGGAIANDVHGKNHHCYATFGRHVLSLELARSDGRIFVCSPRENAPLFAATIGGLGLTGLILRATIQLRRVLGLAMEAEEICFEGLNDFFALARESDQDWEYTAAWIDCQARGARLGRGLYSRARHAPGMAALPPDPSPRLTIPIIFPVALVNGVSVRGFNAAYWRKLGRSGRRRRVGGYEPVLYPLDAVGAWNRLYGRRGFFQFQCVVPPEGARHAVEDGRVTGVRTAQGFYSADAVISTVPTPYVAGLVPDLSEDWRQTYTRITNTRITNIGVVCVILKLCRSVTPHFWVNIADSDMPIPGIIEFSNLRSTMTGETVVFVPYYMPASNPLWSRPDQAFVEESLACISRINPALSRVDLVASHVGRLRHAQPVCPPGFSSMIPPVQTPIRGLQIADTCFYHPEHRGIAESIRLGQAMAEDLWDGGTDP